MPSEHSDQSAYSPGRIFDSQGCKVSSGGNRRLSGSDCAEVQVYLSLYWAHMSEGTFSHVEAHLFLIFFLI